MSEKVTWLIPVKNGMPYLPETLASIEAQTYRDWEVLIWDNGSTDGTVEELHRWIPSRLPGKVVTGSPLSLGNSLARLVEVSPTELCARIDADDLNHPERLEKQVAFMREHPRVGIVGTNVEFIDENGRGIPDAWVQPERDAEIRWQLRWQNPFNHPTVLFRRSAILAAGNYADCVPEDYDLWFRAAAVTETANIPSVLLKYRRLSTSFTATLVATTGYTTPGWQFDAVAGKYADSLFSGLPGDAALKFRDKLAEGSAEDVGLSDLKTLHTVATASARAVGKPASYFRSTDLYSRQQKELIRRWLMQCRWGRTFFTTKRKIRFYLRGRL